MNEKTITFIDAVTKENAVVIIRQVGGHAGEALTGTARGFSRVRQQGAQRMGRQVRHVGQAGRGIQCLPDPRSGR